MGVDECSSCGEEKTPEQQLAGIADRLNVLLSEEESAFILETRMHFLMDDSVRRNGSDDDGLPDGYQTLLERIARATKMVTRSSDPTCSNEQFRESDRTLHHLRAMDAFYDRLDFVGEDPAQYLREAEEHLSEGRITGLDASRVHQYDLVLMEFSNVASVPRDLNALFEGYKVVLCAGPIQLAPQYRDLVQHVVKRMRSAAGSPVITDATLRRRLWHAKNDAIDALIGDAERHARAGSDPRDALERLGEIKHFDPVPELPDKSVSCAIEGYRSEDIDNKILEISALYSQNKKP
ncbi:hypothetical protein HY493_04670 [Candidatus Woesearchaeota archaeon]|nr:hypothetical protein [Candidatus Woesearchaeota archaeon]